MRAAEEMEEALLDAGVDHLGESGVDGCRGVLAGGRVEDRHRKLCAVLDLELRGPRHLCYSLWEHVAVWLVVVGQVELVVAIDGFDVVRETVLSSIDEVERDGRGSVILIVSLKQREVCPRANVCRRHVRVVYVGDMAFGEEEKAARITVPWGPHAPDFTKLAVPAAKGKSLCRSLCSPAASAQVGSCRTEQRQSLRQ